MQALTRFESAVSMPWLAAGQRVYMVLPRKAGLPEVGGHAKAITGRATRSRSAWFHRGWASWLATSVINVRAATRLMRIELAVAVFEP